jgi:hypothetical protein
MIDDLNLIKLAGLINEQNKILGQHITSERKSIANYISIMTVILVIENGIFAFLILHSLGK